MGSFKKDVFGKGGMLHRAFGDRYEVREPQVNMSVACAKAVREGGILFAEGGTGVGKSFAYLIASVSPAIRQARIERGDIGPLVISTSTKVLQDQIWEKDVPDILAATGQDLKVVLVKGRNNYISLRRLVRYKKAFDDNKIRFNDRDVGERASQLVPALSDWADISDTGDFADFGEQLPYEIKSEVESNKDDCQGEACQFHSSCPYHRAKAKRSSADILIVNHALLALHISLGSVLPRECQTFIIDEAHKFFDSVSSAFEKEVSMRQVDRFMKSFRSRLDALREDAESVSQRSVLDDILMELERRKASDEESVVSFFKESQTAVHQAARQSGTTEAASQYAYAILTSEIDASKILQTVASYGDSILEHFDLTQKEILQYQNDGARKFEFELCSIYKTAPALYKRIDEITAREKPELWCYWSDVKRAESDTMMGKLSPDRLTLKRTPIDITEQIKPLFDAKNAVIFTSATLQVSDSFDRVRGQLGLPKDADVFMARTENEDEDGEIIEAFAQKSIAQQIYRSPFPYRENVEIHLFSNILDRPAPSAPDQVKDAYFAQQSQLVEYYLRLRGGRSLVLCSSQRLMFTLYDALEPVLDDMGITPLRQSGTDNLKQTIKAFKTDETSVLFGLASCWEGLDAPGSTLETVIIPQLPFAPPHPLLEARKALLDDPDRQWFYEISLPDMLLQLKQGAGRLVRSMTDKGVIAVLSPRPLTKNYRHDIQKALPPGEIVRNPVDALDFMKPASSPNGEGVHPTFRNVEFRKPCRTCGTMIGFARTDNGKLMPVNLNDFSTHWACEKPGKPKRKEPRE